MKKKVLIITAVIAIVFFAATQIDFSFTNNKHVAGIVVNNDEKSEEQTNLITLTIDATVLKDEELGKKLKDEFKDFVPKDGYFVNNMSITFDAEEYTVDQILEAVSAETDLSFVYGNSTPKFLDSINQIGAKSAGDMSGWMFSINGEFPSTGIDQTIVKDKDNLSFVYTTGDPSEYNEMY